VTLILDSSMCLAWCFDDERTPEVLSVLDRVVEDGAIVPSLWRYEVANGLLMAQRRQRIEASQRDAVLKQLDNLDIRPDKEADTFVWPTTVGLADRHGLTVYDATYLELAQRRRLPLATLDQALRRAATAAAVELA
jgi:predicted nucleic acid-binding protein